MNLGSMHTVEMELAKAGDALIRSLSPNDPFREFYAGMAMPQNMRPADTEQARRLADAKMTVPNAISKALRTMRGRPTLHDAEQHIAKDGSRAEAVAKAQLDVGSLTNLANVTGGQSLGYISLDTQMARGTTRPSSFTMYQYLRKTSAYQIVDYWPYAYDTGGGLPGTAFQSFSNASSGTMSTSAGKYELQYINLKLMTNGRSITTALAAQNNFVDVAAQENINAALTVLETANWTCYYGDPTLFPNQFQGILGQIPAANIVDFQDWYNTFAAQMSWSQSQALFNLIYEQSALITQYRQFGRITHAFMTPTTAGALQALVTTLLNNIVAGVSTTERNLQGIIVDGDLQGMKTRFGEIQFPIDLYINARAKCAQAITLEDGTNMATTTSPTKPVSVAAAVSGGASAGSKWTSFYTASSGIYSYVVASLDTNMNESTVTLLTGNTVSGVTTSGAITLTIVPPGSADAAAFRIYRSGLGYTPTSSGTMNLNAYRYVGVVAASGASNVTFVDSNTKIPGSDDIFLLDLDDNDMALDYRYLLPLTKIELFAQNLFMPWAVAMIGAVRLKIPKFHGLIRNFVPDSPVFNPLAPNTNAAA